jgi:putative membrane protein
MLTAFGASTLFLVPYVIRYTMSGSHTYPGHGWDRGLYLAILFSHMLLAVVVLPMAIRSLYLGTRARYASHRRIARWTWPLWLYVSITGLIVYLMLYPIAGRLYAD